MTKRTRTIGLLLCGVAVAGGLVSTAGAQRRGGYTHRTGKDIYENVCQGCHMPDAKGAVGAGMYPALANNRKLSAALYPANVILRGLRAMPAFSDLDDEQIAAVTNYIRTNYGNAFPGEVTAEQIKALRPTQVRTNMQRPG